VAKGSDVATSFDEVVKTVSTILELRLNQIITDPSSFTRSSFMDMTTRKASDERDYVYGRLELYQQGAMAFLEADYSASIKSVFAAGTIALIRAQENLDALWACCAGSRNGRFDLPSWCRDWSATSYDENMGCGLCYRAKASNQTNIFKAASAKRPRLSHVPEMGVLRVRGVRIDEIASKVFRKSKDGKLNLSEAHALIRAMLLPPRGLRRDQKILETLCRILFVDTFDLRSRAKISHILESTNWLRYLASGQIRSKAIQERGNEEGCNAKQIVKRIIRNILDIQRYGTLFETAGNRLARSCKHVKPGDKICLLYGGRLPSILREAGIINVRDENGKVTKTQAYQLVGGESYVHGLVEGEGLAIAEKQNLPVQDFCLV
jgi:hypothetical protein